MAQVSIGQVENLSYAIRAIVLCAQEAETEAALRIAGVEQKLRETEAFLNESLQLVQEKEDALATAETLLSTAQIALSAAEAALAVMEFVSPAASAALAAAQAALIAAERNREEAIRKLDLARQRAELAHVNYSKAQNLHERVMIECSGRINVINGICAEGKNRLQHALTALEEYLNSNADAKEAYGYLNWRPHDNKPVAAQTIHNRLNLNPAQQKIIIQYLAETDPVFRKEIEDYRKALKAAMGQAERDAILAEMEKKLQDEYAKKMADLAVKPLGDDVQVHIAYTLKDKEKTFIDVIIANLKVPVVLEEGEEAAAPEGGSVAIEIKTGRKKALKSPEEYKELWAKANPGASIKLCVINIKDLPPEDAEEMRAVLKSVDSPILEMLADKDNIDEALLEIIKGEEDDDES